VPSLCHLFTFHGRLRRRGLSEGSHSASYKPTIAQLALSLLAVLAVSSTASGIEPSSAAQPLPRPLPGPPPEVSSLSVGRTLFSPRPNSRGDGRVSVTFLNSAPQRLRVRVVDAAGTAVRDLADGAFGAGQVQLLWDGRTADGAQAPNGSYRIVVERPDGSGPTPPLVTTVNVDAVPTRVRLLRSKVSLTSPRATSFAIPVALSARAVVRVTMRGDAGKRTKTFHASAGKKQLVMPVRGKRLRKALAKGRANVAMRINVSDAAGNRFARKAKLALVPPGVATGDPPGRRNQKLSWPVWGSFSSGFGPRWGRAHQGIDISAPTGVTIGAAADGRVRFAGWMSGFGKTVIIDHGRGMSTLYAHQSSIATSAGRRVLRGQKIGNVGSTGASTGAHLHLEVHRGKTPQNPMKYLAA
jgi:murein DD-endopeptidase MepM/ murein hydrolase activator NlpD